MDIEETGIGFMLDLSGKKFNLLSRETLTVDDTAGFNLVCEVCPKIPPPRDAQLDLESVLTARRELEDVGGLSQSLIDSLDTMERELRRQLSEDDEL